MYGSVGMREEEGQVRERFSHSLNVVVVAPFSFFHSPSLKKTCSIYFKEINFGTSFEN